MRRGIFYYMIAFFLIGFGVLLIFENLGIMSFSFKTGWHYLYPVLIIFLGMKWVSDRFRYRGGSLFFGSLFILFGSLLLLDRFQVITFHFKDIFKLWPLLIIYFGFSLLKGSRPVVVMNWSKGKSDADDIFDDEKVDDKGSMFSVGNYEYNQPNWKVEPMSLRSLAGDFFFDFSKAFIPEKKIPILIDSLAGDVHVLIPEHVEFRVRAHVVAGEIDVVGQSTDGINRTFTFETPGYGFSEQKLDFQIRLKAGSIRINYV
ncbi:MAG TPA: cell wall-active antibiotics response protein LiaF [Cerasibacillus sp.]|uniref:cell wall-active antibiotics response protein LiaF n=1 Tax=Cerasibacillus sp. TaxID=2498711 RepID=UPI002F42ADAF